ncbi:MAG: pseudaminic acid synthase [Deltaproteobacteria bacterium]|nr:pseudaminic acid synthase [Deltaproteobacteria bacterium]
MTSRDIAIAGRRIGRRHPPFVIAEMSGNHNQSLDRALAIVQAAAQAGAHALKLQTYTARSMTLNLTGGEFMVTDPANLWTGRSLFDLYQEAHTPAEWHRPIFNRCAELGLVVFSTPFDDEAVDFLESLGVPAYKIASGECTNLPLVRRVAATGKPVILSTGGATLSELEEAVTAAREAGCADLVLLKCTTTYPAMPENTNLSTIPHMSDLFDVQVGISDHTAGTGVAVAAVALGARVIEKHVTLRRADGGVDSAFSLEPEELRALVVESERAFQALGRVHYGPTEPERASLRYRRSLYVAVDMRAGEPFTRQNLRAVRPGLGLAPKHLDAILGRRVRRDTPAGTALTWDLLD